MSKVEYTIYFSNCFHERLKTLAKKNNTKVVDILREGLNWVFLAEDIKQRGGHALVYYPATPEKTVRII